MLECLILGDSIAKGVSDVRPECVAYVKSGINSKQYNAQYGNKDFTAENVIISLGANDYNSIRTYNELYALREKVKGKRVYWILPNETLKPKQVDDVKLIAISFGDIVIERPKNNMSTDGVHPTYTGYKELAEQTKK